MIKPGAEALVSMALLSELDHRLGREAGEFLIGAGERIGEATTVPTTPDLGQLQVWMNGMWTELGMGEVALSSVQRQLVLRHSLPPIPSSGLLFRKALPFLIEGIYRTWLDQLDPMGHLSRRTVTEYEVEFVYVD